MPAGAARRRLEPEGRRVIHGAGQSPDAFRRYVEAMGDSPPMIYMAYCGLKGDVPAFFRRLEYPEHSPRNMRGACRRECREGPERWPLSHLAGTINGAR